MTAAIDPPTTAPTFVFLFTCAVSLVAVWVGLRILEDEIPVVCDEVVCVMKLEVEEGVGLDAVISVLLVALSISAAVALKSSRNTTSRYAHAGIAVPIGTGFGNLRS